MGIGVLDQVYDETRRLAIAGSTLAPGDFRLKKLVAPLQQAGAKAPVLGKVGEAVDKLVQSKPQQSAEALLELSALVTAILYTQGETGAAGDLKPLEASPIAGGLTTTTSARVMKPVLEALTTTGADRLKMIRAAHEQGAFRDLRLVGPALAALDDGYAEIGDFVADHVLPLYGKAIYGELKERCDLKGRGGHPRRLRLMHRLDPEATRPLVEEALDSGSKEMKLAALGCLGRDKDDIPRLLEQTRAKAKEVRAVALRAVAHFDDAEVVETLTQALSGGDLELAVIPASLNPNPKLLEFVLARAQQQIDELLAAKDKAKVKKELPRFHRLLACFHGRSDKQSVDFLTRLFDQRDEIVKLKGDNIGGEDVNNRVASLSVKSGSKPAVKKLIDLRDTLSPHLLAWAFAAAARTRKPSEVYELFSPLLTKGDAKKKKDAAAEKCKILVGLLTSMAYRHGTDDAPDAEEPTEDEIDFSDIGDTVDGWGAITVLRDVKLDPRWLDAAVALGDRELIEPLSRPDHPAATAFLDQQAEAGLKRRDIDHNLLGTLRAMLRIRHPQAIDRFLELLQKIAKAKQQYYFNYWIVQLVTKLPPEALPRIEELLPTFPEKLVNELMPHLDELRLKA